MSEDQSRDPVVVEPAEGTEAEGRMRPVTARLVDAGSRTVSAASLAFFRIAFGTAMLINSVLYIRWRVHDFYIAPSMHFPFEPFGFVRPVPGAGMYAVFVLMAVTGGLIALGLWYRWAVAGFFLLKTYVFLIESSYFQNHDYLIVLLAFLLLFLPADRMWSADALRHPERASPTVPAWTVWLLTFQIAVPYFFGGVAKLNADWLRGEPLRMWLARSVDRGDIGEIFTNETVVVSMAYGSLAFDLMIVGFLLHRRTRLPAFLVATGFHLFNAYLFGLIIFPWLMIAATTVFFAPDWPERVLGRLRRWSGSRPLAPMEVRPPGASAPAARRPARMRPVVVACLTGWVAVQVLLPMRHLAIPGSPNWTEQGHRFAWHMKLRDKQGSATFVVATADEVIRVSPDEYLTPRQHHRLVGHPERLARFARHLSGIHDGAEVRAETAVSLNGRPRVPIVDPTIDLASVDLPWLTRPDWILPLDEPLP